MRSRTALYAELEITRSLLADANRELTLLRRQRVRRAESGTQTDHETPSGGSAECSLDAKQRNLGVDAATQTDHETSQGGSASPLALPPKSSAVPDQDHQALPADTTSECPDTIARSRAPLREVSNTYRFLEPGSLLPERPPLQIVVQKIQAGQTRQAPARKALLRSPTKRTPTAPRKLNQPRKKPRIIGVEVLTPPTCVANNALDLTVNR